MKLLFPLLLFSLISSVMCAQKDFEALKSQEYEYCKEAYQLEEIQSVTLNRVLTRKYQMLKGIQYLKSSDFNKFLELRRSIYKGIEGSIQLILTEDQMALYNDEKIKKRRVNSEKVEALKKQGASKQQLLDASLGIDW